MPDKPLNQPDQSIPPDDSVQSGINGAVAGLLGFNLLLLAVITLLILFTAIPTLAADTPATTLPASLSQVETVTPGVTRPANSVTPAPQPSGTPLPTSTVTIMATRISTHTPTPTASATRMTTATTEPILPEPSVIGRSVQGYPLEIYQFGSGPTQRLIVAGIHGGYEANTSQLAWALIKHLSQYPELIPGEVTLYILPVLNPDGLTFSKDADGRANANGVDLNRNWDADWQADWPLDGCWQLSPVTAGNHPGSEPETQALMAFIQSHKPDALISYHSAALGIFPGGKPIDPAALHLAEQVAEVSNYPYPPLNTGCTYTGQLIDWAARQGIAALDIELSTHSAIDWQTSLDILDVFLAWQSP